MALFALCSSSPQSTDFIARKLPPTRTSGRLSSHSTFAEWAPGGFGIGAVINSIISFLITAFVVFVLVKAVNRLTAKKKKEEEPKPEPPKGPTTEELLVEIRDLLKQQEDK